MTTLEQLGGLLRKYRKSLGLSQAALAEKSKIHRNTLSALESGMGNVELNTLLAVCEQLGLELDLVPAPIAAAVRPRAIPLHGSLGELLQKSVPHAQEGPAVKAASTGTVGMGKAASSVESLSPLMQRVAARLAASGKSKDKDRK